MLNATNSGIMITLFAGMGQGKNHYTKISINKIKEYLEKYHKIHVERRWIFYCVAYLLKIGFITRKSRYQNKEKGLIRQYSSLISFKLKGVIYLVKNYADGAKKLYKSMVKFGQKEDKRWPSEEFEKDTNYQAATPEEQKRLNDLLASVGRDISQI